VFNKVKKISKVTEHKDILIAAHFNYLVTEPYSVLNEPFSCYSIRNTVSICYCRVIIYSHTNNAVSYKEF